MRSTRNPVSQLVKSVADVRKRHRVRRTPSGFQFALADRIAFLNPPAWDEVVAGRRFFLRREVLAAVEAHLPENLSPRYALVFSDGRPVAAIAAQLVDIQGANLWNDGGEDKPAQRSVIGRILKPATGKIVSQIEERALIAGNLMSWGFDGIIFAKDVDPVEIWPGVTEALYRIRRAERLAGQTDLVLIKDVTATESHSEALRTFSYRPLETDPNMVLAIDPSWKSYDDYLGALDAKYRKNAKDQMKKLAASGCVMETLTDLEPYAADIHRLYRSVQGKASVKLVTLTEGYLPALARAAGADFRCTVVRRDDHVLGFISCLRDGDTAVGYYIGFDREAASEGIPLYLRLLHTTVSDAIAWGCKRLSLGRTALEPKAALGAKPEPMYVWLRHRVPAMNWLVRGMLDAIPHSEPPERNPFKAGKTEPTK